MTPNTSIPCMSKVFCCFPVNVNRDHRWEVQVAKGGGDWQPAQIGHFYFTEAECETVMVQFDIAENGDDAWRRITGRRPG